MEHKMSTEVIFDLFAIISESHPDLDESKVRSIAEFIAPRADTTFYLDEVERWCEMYLLSEQPEQPHHPHEHRD